ncbi:MAG: hypothetical protein E6230_03585 [Paenibacillus dendritiformis]|uniref:hypothetical protein n=1 Tax=uncultured Paenibacillus sp. TaxID=227322 RepID=UPI0025F34DC7|nr:hypothetical protein [uncultured Paenibacillus sp.]MDU5141252.1 hypothetical protein [Paenibacillus dendritiformis]
MNLMQFYKNFNMGREIDIAGTFIYNGMKSFDAMKGFSEECDIFHFLYSFAVGIERLQKVLLVLLENFPDEITDERIADFEKALITHSHQKLHGQISTKLQLEFNAHQHAFLQLLTQFYETCRYDRFNISPNYHKERDMFVSFLSNRLNMEIRVNQAFWDTPNDTRIKKFLGRIVGAITRTYYNAIKEQARKLGIFTYELRFDSPAYKLFQGEIKDNSFQELLLEERIALAEFLVYLLNYDSVEELRGFIKTIEPLDLGLNELEIYFNDICRGTVPVVLVDSVTYHYEEMDNSIERLKIMDVLSSSF